MLTHNDPKGMVIKYYVCDWQDTSLTPIKVGNSTVGRRKGFREYNSTHEAHSYTKTDLRNSPAHPGAVVFVIEVCDHEERPMLRKTTGPVVL